MTQIANIGRPTSALAARWSLTDEKLSVVRSMIAPEAPDDVIDLYFERCKIAGCDPFSKMIYVVNRPSKAKSGEVSKRKDGKVDRWTFQSSIDLFRSIADASDKYEGQVGPFWCGEDGVWTDVWLSDKNPAAAKVGVLKRGFKETLWGVARWKSYVQQSEWDGVVTVNGLWKSHCDVMIAKCGEALALRKAFPQKLKGLYIAEEMANQDAVERPASVVSISPVVTVPQPAIAAGPKKDRPKSAAELKALFESAQIPGEFGAWLIEKVAPDLQSRAKRALFPSEALEAERQISAYAAPETVENAEYVEDDVEPLIDQQPTQESSPTTAVEQPQTPEAPTKPVPPVFRGLIDSVAAECRVTPSVAADIERVTLNGREMTRALAEKIVQAIKDVAEGAK